MNTARFYVLALCLTLVATAQSDEVDDLHFKPADVFQLEYASDPQVSPDGKRVVYVRNSMDIMTDETSSKLWIVGTDGSEHRPLTTGDGNASTPRWSPDGERLIYASSHKKSTQIFCRWMDTGQTAKLSNLTASPASLVWSRDGKQIAFTMHVEEKPDSYVKMPAKPDGAEWAEDPKVIRKVRYRFDGRGYLKDGFRQLFVLSAEGGTPRQLTSSDFDHVGTPCWSRDGSTLFFSANRARSWDEPRNSDIFKITLKDRKITQLTDRDGPDFHPIVSRDGKQIAYIGFDDHERHGYSIERLYTINVDGSNSKLISHEFDRDVAAAVWNGDDSGFYFQFNDFGSTKVGLMNLDGVATERARNVGGVTLGRPYSSGSFSVSPSGVIAYTSGNTQRPADVSVVASNGKIKRITSLNEDLLGHKQLGAVEEFRFKSSADGRQIQGWIVKPPGFDAKKKYPLILEIHGGPFADYGDRFSAEIQLYAAAGYVVVYINPRGSTGYGKEFGNLIHHAYPGRDYDDLMSGVDEVIRRGYVDEKRQFVTGGSGGGILTAWIVGKTNRFRAAVAAKPVINWYSFALTSDAYPFFAEYWFPGFPWEKPDEYLRRSPISLVGNVKTPTMLLTGEVDYRTPISESEQFYQALKLRKIDTALVRVPGASHGIASRPSRLVAKVAHILKWFETH